MSDSDQPTFGEQLFEHVTQFARWRKRLFYCLPIAFLLVLFAIVARTPVSVVAALADGTIDVISSGHAPLDQDSKPINPTIPVTLECVAGSGTVGMTPGTITADKWTNGSCQVLVTVTETVEGARLRARTK